MRNSSHNLIPILLKLCRHCDHALKISGEDPGFLKGGFKYIERGFVFNILPDFFHKFPHENEIIWSQRGVQANHPNPL